MGFRLLHFHLTLNHYKGQGQGYACFNSEYLESGDRYEKYSLIQVTLTLSNPSHSDTL